MPRSILVTGGAEFIGSQVVELLVQEECDVTALNNLDPQVHGQISVYLSTRVEGPYITGDVRSEKQLRDIVTMSTQ